MEIGAFARHDGAPNFLIHQCVRIVYLPKRVLLYLRFIIEPDHVRLSKSKTLTVDG